MALLGYPPHITLAIYDGDAVSEAEARTALQLAAEILDSLLLTFDAIRTFDGPPMVLWASPRPDPNLQAVHAAVHASIDPIHCRPYYRPEAWLPHCTLGTNVRNDLRQAALAFAQEFRENPSVLFDALDLISFPPLSAIELRKLP